MNRRPICIVCIGLMIAIWICRLVGAPIFGAPQLKPEIASCLEEGYHTKLVGQVASRTQKPNSVQYILTHVQATVRGETIQIQQVKITDQSDMRYALGSDVEVTGKLQRIAQCRNPGQFDARAFYGCQKLYYEALAEEMVQVRHGGTRGFVRESLLRFRETLCDNLNQIMHPEQAGVLAAMLLGDRSGIRAESKRNYQISGMMHVLAISGMHISLLGMGLYEGILWLLIPLRGRRFGRREIRIAAVLASIGMGIFCLFVGNPVSSVRAVVMFAVMLGAKLTERSYDTLCALGLAGILILVGNPGYLFYSGFQLSFAAVIGAAVCYPALFALVPKSFWRKGSRIKGLMHKAAAMLLLWLAVTVTTLPLICFYYYEIPLLGFLTNLLFVPLMGVILEVGLVGGVLSLFALRAGWAVLIPVDVCLQMIDTATGVLRNLPGAVWIVGKPELWQVFLCYGMLGLVLLLLKRQARRSRVTKSGAPGKQMRRTCVAVCLCLAIGLTPLLGLRQTDPVRVTMLDVGQGDCAVVQSRAGKAVLIDCGSSNEQQVGTYRLLPFLKCQGISTVTCIFLSHADEDHVGGITELLTAIEARETSIRVQTLCMPYWMKNEKEGQQMEALCQAIGTRVRYAEAGDEMQMQRCTFSVLHPNRTGDQHSGNAGSMVLTLQAGAFSMLFTGDLEGEGETEMLARLAPVDCLKVAHHGSRYSTSDAFLKRVSPEISLISAPKKSQYGHPHAETLERLQACGSDCYITRDCGAITLRIRGTEVIVQPFLRKDA